MQYLANFLYTSAPTGPPNPSSQYFQYSAPGIAPASSSQYDYAPLQNPDPRPLNRHQAHQQTKASSLVERKRQQWQRERDELSGQTSSVSILPGQRSYFPPLVEENRSNNGNRSGQIAHRDGSQRSGRSGRSSGLERKQMLAAQYYHEQVKVLIQFPLTIIISRNSCFLNWNAG